MLDTNTCSVCPALHLAVAAGNVPVIEALVSPLCVSVSSLVYCNKLLRRGIVLCDGN